LVATLEGLADITIFAPSNEAFATLTAFAAENNLVLSDAVVSAVLALHVGQGVAFSSDIITAAAAVDVVTALGGLKISASVDDGKVKITAPGNFATVNVADVLVANGVVHVVDTVMLPDLSTLGTEKTTPSFT
jgi:transforming growth factor-beta-induced protein